jgi:hypothetical protein
MSAPNEPREQTAPDKSSSGNQRGAPPRDLIDFYRRWPEFREVAVALAARADLSAAQSETMRWLILLVDRIGERDIGPLDRA